MLRITLDHCDMQDLDGIYALSHTLSQYFPQPDQFTTAIHELLMNALEHGTLGIGFEMKTLLQRAGTWKDEVIRRLKLPEYANKAVEITLEHDAQACRLTITDQGDGFAWAGYWGNEMPHSLPNGRGLWIAYHAPFDLLRFNDAGNAVTCVAHL